MTRKGQRVELNRVLFSRTFAGLSRALYWMAYYRTQAAEYLRVLRETPPTAPASMRLYQERVSEATRMFHEQRKRVRMFASPLDVLLEREAALKGGAA